VEGLRRSVNRARHQGWRVASPPGCIVASFEPRLIVVKNVSRAVSLTAGGGH